MTGLALYQLVRLTHMAAADFCQPIPAPLDAGSTRQIDRSPRVRRATFTLILAAFTMVLSVQVSGFEDICLLTQYNRLICDSCSSSQCFACGFLQIPPRDGHPCRPAKRSPCRAGRELSPPSRPTATITVEIASKDATRHAWRTNEKAGSFLMTLPIRWPPKMPLLSPEKMYAHPRSLLDATPNFFFKI